MALPIIVQLAASSDIAASMANYDSVYLGLGQRFYEQVKGRLQLIANRQVRAIKVPKFPYVIYYRAHTNRIEVIAVVHGSRDASAWKSRI